MNFNPFSQTQKEKKGGEEEGYPGIYFKFYFLKNMRDYNCAVEIKKRKEEKRPTQVGWDEHEGKRGGHEAEAQENARNFDSRK